jgi:hypothetical protein
MSIFSYEGGVVAIFRRLSRGFAQKVGNSFANYLVFYHLKLFGRLDVMD